MVSIKSVQIILAFWGSFGTYFKGGMAFLLRFSMVCWGPADLSGGPTGTTWGWVPILLTNANLEAWLRAHAARADGTVEAPKGGARMVANTALDAESGSSVALS